MNAPILLIAIAVLLASCATKLTVNQKAQLQSELAKLSEIDQVAAYIPQGKYKGYTQQQWENFKDSVFTSNKNRAEALFNKHGFLGFDKVGQEGSTNFWLLVQHSDKYPDFQRGVLTAMDGEVKKSNASPTDYALLYDRVKVNAGLKQLFGTQVTYEVETTGRAIPQIGLVDLANIDKLRQEYKLEPLKDYLNRMTTMHYEMNKEFYEKKGVLNPTLY